MQCPLLTLQLFNDLEQAKKVFFNDGVQPSQHVKIRLDSVM